MTHHDDAQLASWLNEGPAHEQSGGLERALSAARATRQRPAWLVAATGGTIGTARTNRSVGFMWGVVAAIALIGLLIGGLVVGGWLRLQPTPDALLLPSATAIPSTSAFPSASVAAPTPSPEVPLGGGLILVFQRHEPRDPCDDRFPGGPFDILSLDAGTGEQTLLGTTAEDCSTNWLALQWAPDREHILMTDDFGQETLDLDTPTAAGRDLTFICCDLPTDIWKGGASAFDGWLLSPAGDRVAAIGSGIEGTARIVVANIDGSGLANLSVPEGAQIRGWATWAPDQSALVVAACLPCNEAIEVGQPATAENHDHLYVVPVDGSPVRELLDDIGGWFWTPFWSPDGSTFATVRRECASPEASPNCSNPDITSSLMLVAAENGSSRVLVTSDQLGEGLTEIGLPLWSRDGGRIAFDAANPNGDDPHAFVVDADGTSLVDLGAGSPSQWSPDGEWILVSRSAGEEASPELWIMRPDGSDARSLGNFLQSFFGGAGW
jgi:Tol biopolymer transport system component